MHECEESPRHLLVYPGLATLRQRFFKDDTPLEKLLYSEELTKFLLELEKLSQKVPPESKGRTPDIESADPRSDCPPSRRYQTSVSPPPVGSRGKRKRSPFPR